MKQTINKRLTLWLLTLALAVAALPVLTAPAQAAKKTPVDVVFGTETVKGEKEKPYGTTFVYCENVSYTLENPNSNDPYYAAYDTWATGDVRIADTVEGLEVRKIRSSFFKEVTGNVTLGKNISSLDYCVFSGGKLREVTIPADSKLKRICQYAFRACPNLVRVGVGNTDKLPASVTDIDYYAFYESPAIKSIDLTQTKVKSIDDCTFTDCTALASVKLPDGLISIGHSAFKGCTALKALDVPASVKSIGMDTFSYSGIMDLKLRCGAVSASGMSIARSLMALPDGAKVYLPRPSNSAEYERAMQFIYGNGQYTYCGANAKVKTYWLNSNTGPVTEPSARSNSVVTLSGKDKDNNPVSFNYDYTDADNDGLGAVIHPSGRQNGATLKLKLNGSGTTNNTNAVIFTRVRAYDYDSAGNAGHAKGLETDVLYVYEGGTATITAKSEWKAESVVLRYIVCDGTINLKAETVNGFAYANATKDFPVAGKGRLNVNVQGKTAYPFYYVTFMGDDEGNPLIVRAHTRTTAKGGTAYVNYGNVTTKKNVDVVMEVESAASGADAYGILSGRALSVGHTAGSLTLRTAAGTTLKDQLAPQAYYNAENFAVTGDWKGKDFVTFTAISADTLLISNTSGGAVTLYQNTALSSDSSRLIFTAKGGTAPYNWTLTGTLPAGMSLPETTDAQAQITGTPTAVGTFPVTLTVTDSNGRTANTAVTITVDAANLVMKEDTTTGIFRGSKLYLPLNSDWATNTNWKEELPITSI